MRSAALLLMMAAGIAPAQDARPAAFAFRNGFWVNLHHFLYQLGQPKPTVTETSADDAPWTAAVDEYRSGLSKKDAVFDKDLIAVTIALANAGNAESLAGVSVPESLRAALERAAPVYRRVWWERHSAANRAWIEEQQRLLGQYGKPVGAFLAKVMRQSWPADGHKVEVCAYGNWAGGYSTDGGLIVIASLDRGNMGTRGLEIVFHESMHQWDDSTLGLLNTTAKRLNVQISPRLFHSIIFYTAGYAIAQAAPGHRPYAENMWGRMPGKQALDAHWLPYLKGEGSLEQAIEGVVKASAL